MQKLIFIVICISFLACKEDPAYKTIDYQLKYNLSDPDEVYLLPEKLKEISGIQVIDSNIIACIQDEEGIIFLFNLKTKKIEKEIVFAEKGDFEDLEIIDDNAFVIQSNGTIFNIKNFLSDNPEVIKIKINLHKGCNVEGLTHIKKGQYLLFACKDAPGIKPNEDKAVYAYNFNNNKLEKEPYLRISNSKVEELINQGEGWEITMDLKKFIDGDKALFRPSAIALHPFSNEIYLLSSVNKLLCIIDQEGNIINVYPLENKYFRQPEGICFNMKGDLYISNEASGGTANILKFNYGD